MSDNYRKLVSNLREMHYKDAEITRLRDLAAVHENMVKFRDAEIVRLNEINAELLAACQAALSDKPIPETYWMLFDAIKKATEAQLVAPKETVLPNSTFRGFPSVNHNKPMVAPT